ncbi:MAG TPA: hypothetical protein VFN51_00160 [Candidatus Saccharimonadales bacterium]|nr:hypothetical protein [Candidatus Saccharimonadales bacterium]
MAFAIPHTHAGKGNRFEERDKSYLDYEDTRGAAAIDRSAQRQKFGGFHLGAALFGWLVSTGIATILISILTAAGAAVALTQIKNATNISAQGVSTIGLTGGILFLIVLIVSYYAGGYVAGRLSRFDGARQGFGVWAIGILITIILAALGAAIGSKYNVLQQMNLPHIPIKAGSFTTGGLITSLIAIVVTLLAAVSGGKLGERYHRRVDEAGLNPS